MPPAAPPPRRLADLPSARPRVIQPAARVYRHQPFPVAPLTKRLWHAALVNAAEGDDLFFCRGCLSYWPDAFAAGRTGRAWFCERCAHGDSLDTEGLPS